VQAERVHKAIAALKQGTEIETELHSYLIPSSRLPGRSCSGSRASSRSPTSGAAEISSQLRRSPRQEGWLMSWLRTRPPAKKELRPATWIFLSQKIQNRRGATSWLTLSSPGRVS